MDFQLPEFASTLAVGGLVLLSLWYVFSLCIGDHHQPAYLHAVADKGWLAKLFLLVFVATVGMLAEDLSNKYVDTEDLPWTLPPMESEDDARRKALFGDSVTLQKPDPLALTVAKQGSLSRHGGEYGEFVERLVLARAQHKSFWYGSCTHELVETVKQEDREWPQECELDADKLETIANTIYYAGKNEVYRVPQYYDELKKIQTRIDFARSIALISITFLGVALICAILKVIGWLALHGYTRARRVVDASYFRSSGDERIRIIADHLRIGWTIAWLAVGTLALSIFYAGGSLAYGAEEREFNRRAFGYSASLVSARGTAQAPLRSDASVSAMVYLEGGPGYLLFSDTKVDYSAVVPIEDRRVALLTINEFKGVRSTPTVVDWSIVGVPPNDLEAACVIPGHSDRVLVFESGDHPSEAQEPLVARIIEIAIERGPPLKVSVIRSWIRPVMAGQVEGAVCLGDDPHKPIVVVLGMRDFKEGGARLVQLDLADDRATVRETYTSTAFEKKLPGQPYNRAISDLYLDDKHRLWAVATHDPGSNLGPFRSVIYRLGDIVHSTSGVFNVEWRIDQFASVDGLKIEAIAPWLEKEATSDVLIASDDELYGGVWRRLAL